MAKGEYKTRTRRGEVAATFWLPSEQWEEFQALCALKGTTATAQLEQMVREYIKRPPRSRSMPLLTATQLAERLGVARTTVLAASGRPGFDEWSRERDPDNVAWIHNGESRKKSRFLPKNT